MLSTAGSGYMLRGVDTLVAKPIITRNARQAQMINLVQAERAQVELEEGCEALADAAVSDAITLIECADLQVLPFISLSDDGILSLQWQAGDYGVALLFAGDHLASLAFRRPGQLYAENGVEIAVSEPLPASFYEAMGRITSS